MTSILGKRTRTKTSFRHFIFLILNHSSAIEIRIKICLNIINSKGESGLNEFKCISLLLFSSSLQYLSNFHIMLNKLAYICLKPQTNIVCVCVYIYMTKSSKWEFKKKNELKILLLIRTSALLLSIFFSSLFFFLFLFIQLKRGRKN
jgi:hypothetical protein